MKGQIKFKVPKDATIIWNFFYENMPTAWKNQNLFAIKLANGFTIDMGWYPDFDENGEYHAIIVDNDWEKEPIEEFFSKDEVQVKEWIQEKINEYSSKK